MLYLSLGLHGLLLLIPINVPEPPEADTASAPDSLDRVSMATLAPSALEGDPSEAEPSEAPEPEAAPEPTPPTPPAQTPPAQTPPPQARSTPPPAAVEPPAAQPEADAVEPAASPQSSDPVESSSAESDPVVQVEGGPVEDGPTEDGPPPPPPPPEPLADESAGSAGTYEYNPAEVAQSEEQDGGGLAIWIDWWEPLATNATVASDRMPIEKDLQLSHTTNVCLDTSPGVAFLATVVDHAGEIDGELELIRGTGYAPLNDEAIELVKEYDFPASEDTREAYVFRVTVVDYDPENCVAPSP